MYVQPETVVIIGFCVNKCFGGSSCMFYAANCLQHSLVWCELYDLLARLIFHMNFLLLFLILK